MSLTENHVIAGLPAWATTEEAAEAAAALGHDLAPEYPVTDEQRELDGRRAEWQQIRAAAIVGRAQAIRGRAWALADQLAGIIRDTERYLDAMVAAFLGAGIPAAPKKGENRLFDALLAMGEIDPEAVRTAARQCREHDNSRKASSKPAPAAPKAAKPAESPERQAVQAHVRDNGVMARAAAQAWAEAQGFSDRIVTAMIRDGQLVETRKGVTA